MEPLDILSKARRRFTSSGHNNERPTRFGQIQTIASNSTTIEYHTDCTQNDALERLINISVGIYLLVPDEVDEDFKTKTEEIQ